MHRGWLYRDQHVMTLALLTVCQWVCAHNEMWLWSRPAYCSPRRDDHTVIIADSTVCLCMCVYRRHDSGCTGTRGRSDCMSVHACMQRV